MLEVVPELVPTRYLVSSNSLAKGRKNGIGAIFGVNKVEAVSEADGDGVAVFVLSAAT